MRKEAMTAQKFRALLARLALLLLVWGLVVHFVSRAVVTYPQYRAVSRELAQASAEYERMFHDYSERLWEGDRLANDKEYQRQLLKNSYYYYEANEQPMIVVDQ